MSCSVEVHIKQHYQNRYYGHPRKQQLIMQSQPNQIESFVNVTHFECLKGNNYMLIIITSYSCQCLKLFLPRFIPLLLLKSGFGNRFLELKPATWLSSKSKFIYRVLKRNGCGLKFHITLCIGLLIVYPYTVLNVTSAK